METIRDSSARYFPLSQTIGDEYVSLFVMSRTMADSSGRYFPSSWTIRDEYVFHFSMSNRLLDRYLGRGAKAYAPCAFIVYTFAPCGAFVGAYAIRPYPAGKKEVSLGRYYLLSRTMADKYASFFSMSNRLSDRYPGRGVLNTPHIDSTSTHSPFAGRLVGRMQYAPTLLEKDEVSLGRYYLLSRTMADKSVFHSIMFNRLSDRYPGRAQKHTPLARLSSTPSPLAGRLVGRMQYAPTFPEKIRFPRAGVFHRLGQ